MIPQMRMNFQRVNVEHNFSAVCFCYAYVGMFNLLSYIVYYFSVILMYKRVYFLPGGKNSRVK